MFGRFSRRGAGTGKDPSPEDSYLAERERMVDMQLAARGITDERVLQAMRIIPRHLFVPESARVHAYEDHPINIGCSQTISQPYMVATMSQMLALRPTDRVLEIGTGSGYQTAILATLAAHVTTVERIGDLARNAEVILDALGYRNVNVHSSDGTLGWKPGSPYDAIIVTAASPSMPASLKGQLADSGRLICPVGSRDAQRLVRVIRRGVDFHEDESVGCIFVPLIGEEGWPN